MTSRFRIKGIPVRRQEASVPGADQLSVLSGRHRRLLIRRAGSVVEDLCTLDLDVEAFQSDIVPLARGQKLN